MEGAAEADPCDVFKDPAFFDSVRSMPFQVRNQGQFPLLSVQHLGCSKANKELQCSCSLRSLCDLHSGCTFDLQRVFVPATDEPNGHGSYMVWANTEKNYVAPKLAKMSRPLASADIVQTFMKSCAYQLHVEACSHVLCALYVHALQPAATAPFAAASYLLQHAGEFSELHAGASRSVRRAWRTHRTRASPPCSAPLRASATSPTLSPMCFAASPLWSCSTSAAVFAAFVSGC